MEKRCLEAQRTEVILWLFSPRLEGRVDDPKSRLFKFYTVCYSFSPRIEFKLGICIERTRVEKK